MYLLSTTNPRKFSATIPSTVLLATTNPRSFSARLKISTSFKLKVTTNPRIFSAQLLPGIRITLLSTTNPRKFSAKVTDGIVLLAKTNPRSFSAVLAGLPILTLLAKTNPRKAYFILALPESDQFTVMVMNLTNKLVSFYENFNFNSACLFNGKYIAAGDDGIYELTGPNDNGAPIDASILLGDYDFGINNKKTVPRLYMNYSGDGEAQVSVNVDQEEDLHGPFQIPAPEGDKVQTRRAKLPLGLRGSHWQYLIENVEGSQINIQNLELQFQKSQRRLH